MWNFHHMIINHICKVISRVSIWLDKYLIVKNAVVKHNSSMYHIFPLTCSMRYKHSYHILFSVCNPLLHLRLAEVKAESIILRSLMFLSTLFNPQLFQPISSAETVIGVSLVNKSLYLLLIELDPLRLHVRTTIAFLLGALVPLNPAPS